MAALNAPAERPQSSDAPSPAPTPPPDSATAAAAATAADKVKKRKKAPSVPVQFVRWKSVFGPWRIALEKDSKAAAWRSCNLTPNTLFQSPLAIVKDGRASLTLWEARTPQGQVRLYFGLPQILVARQAMLDRGVNKDFLRRSFDNDWIVEGYALEDLHKVTFSSSSSLVERAKQLRTVARRQDPAGETSSNASTSSSSSRSASPAELSAKKHYARMSSTERKRLASTSLPTPSTSHEATPEPITSSSLSPTSADVTIEALPRLVKRLKTTLSPAAEAKQLAKERLQAREFAFARKSWMEAQSSGRTTFLSLDFETWERSHDCLLEVGWSLKSFEADHKTGQVGPPREEDRHVIVKEHLAKRNGRYSPDARDHFDFGKSQVMEQRKLYDLLHALFTTLSTSQRLFLVFHDPRADLRTLHDLGFDPAMFTSRVGAVQMEAVAEEGLFVIDTQAVYSAWAGKKEQTKLTTCCEAVQLELKRAHNAGNDAVYTRRLLEKMLDPNVERPEPRADWRGGDGEL